MTRTPEEIKSLEESYSEKFYAATMNWSNRTERSLQDQDAIIGVSSLGHCSEKVRRMLMKEPASSPQPDKLAAFVGTWLGAGVEQAILAEWPESILQSEIEVTLDTDQGTFVIGGHPDLILPNEGILLDVKTVDKLASVTSYSLFEDNQQKKFQRHMYGLGAWENGSFGEIELEDVLVGNLWIDRSGQDHHFHLRLEPFNPDVIAAAGDWLSTVVYSFKMGVEAPKEPPRHFCESWCEFYANCRALDTDAEGIIEDPIALQAISLYQEGGRMEREGKKMKDQAKTELVGVQGSNGEVVLRWVEVGATEVPAFTRRGYSKPSFSKIKPPKKEATK